MRFYYYFPLLLLNLLPFQVTSQNTFQKYYYTGGGYGNSLKVTSDHGFIIAGVAGTVGGQIKINVVKTDSLGNIQWGKSYDGNEVDIAEFVGQTNDGGYYIGGATKSGNSIDHDFFLMRIDSLGNLLWSKTYGGIGDDRAYYGKQVQNNGFIIGGYTSSFGANTNDIYVIRTDEMGDTLWTRTYGTIYYASSYSMAQTHNNNFVITGYHEATNNIKNLLLLNINLDGDINWSKLINTGYDESGDEIQMTADSGFVVTGSVHGGHLHLMKFDSIGTVEWARFYGSVDKRSYSVKQTYDLGYIMTGVSPDSVAGFTDAFLVKTDSVGNVLWSQKYGKQGYDFGNEVVQTSDSCFAFTGIFTPWPSNFNNLGLIKTNSLGISGCFEYSFSMNSFSPVLTNSNITLSVSSGATVNSLPLNITSPIALTTYCASVGLEPYINDPIINISPIPANQYITIKLSSIISRGYLELLDPIGNIHFRKVISSASQMEINLLNVAQGVYVIRLFDGIKFLYRNIIVVH